LDAGVVLAFAVCRDRSAAEKSLLIASAKGRVRWTWTIFRKSHDGVGADAVV
jgi:hypothetical protein